MEFDRAAVARVVIFLSVNCWGCHALAGSNDRDGARTVVRTSVRAADGASGYALRLSPETQTASETQVAGGASGPTVHPSPETQVADSVPLLVAPPTPIPSQAVAGAPPTAIPPAPKSEVLDSGGHPSNPQAHETPGVSGHAVPPAPDAQKAVDATTSAAKQRTAASKANEELKELHRKERNRHCRKIAIDLSLVFLIGCLFGVGELVSRYRDAPAGALKNLSALLYILANGVASLVALLLIWVFGWNFGITQSDEAIRWVRVLVAGFSAMALFRSSFFVARVGNQDIGVGPSAFLQVLLSAADREVDRLQAAARDRVISLVMDRISYVKAKEPLVAYCLGLMQNVSAAEQSSLGLLVTQIGKGDTTTDQTKARLLGLLLLSVVGDEVLRSAVNTLRADIEISPGAQGGGGGAGPVCSREPCGARGRWWCRAGCSREPCGTRLRCRVWDCSSRSSA